MNNISRYYTTILIVAATMPAIASAQVTSKGDSGDIKWSATTGLGYDSNAFLAPRKPYVDYAAGKILGANPTVIPQKKTGFFVPLAIKSDFAQDREANLRIIGSALADGKFYPSLGNANEYSMTLRGGPEFILDSQGKDENTVYLGALLGKHKKIYTDHDTGLPKTTTLTSSDISNRYNYIDLGGEAEYKHKIGEVDYSLRGKYILYNFDTPTAVAKMDHTYFLMGAESSFHVTQSSKLDLSFDHFVKDYSKRHARDAQGVYATANPLLNYTFNTIGAALHGRLTPEWVMYFDLKHTQRVDGFMNYNNYGENRYGLRVLYGQDRIKARLSLHHWNRSYPNAFAYDVVGQPAKAYDGNDLKFKLQYEQTKSSSIWAEWNYKAHNSSDLRYDYGRNLFMAGMTWVY